MSKLKEIKRPASIPVLTYKYQMSLIGINGEMSFNISPCKEEVYHMVGKAIGFDYRKRFMEDMIGSSWVKEPIDVDNPGIIFFLSKNKKFSSARRINRIVKLLNKQHKLKEPEVFMYEGTAAILIKIDKWYYQSPVALSGMLTFIRAAARTNFDFESLEDFISKASKIDKSQDKQIAGADTNHLSKARRNENLDGFLNKTLPIFNHKGGNAWRIGRRIDIPYDGIANYDTSEERYSDISDGIYQEVNCETW